jgi:hypothetical protein
MYPNGPSIKLQAAPVFKAVPWWRRWLSKQCQHVNQQVYDRIEHHNNYEFDGQPHELDQRFTGIVCLDCGEVLKEHQYE